MRVFWEEGQPKSVALILSQKHSLASNDIARMEGNLAVAFYHKALASPLADMAVFQHLSLAYTHKNPFFLEPTFLLSSPCFWILGLSFGVRYQVHFPVERDWMLFLWLMFPLPQVLKLWNQPQTGSNLALVIITQIKYH